MFTRHFGLQLTIGLFTLSNVLVLYPSGYDNRFFPFTSEWSCPRTTCKPSSFFSSLAIYTSNDAFQDDDKDIGIPEIWGKYDQQKLTKALVLNTDCSNPISDAITGSGLPANSDMVDLPWRIDGKIEGQAINFHYEQRIFKYVSVGFSGALMHIFSRHLFEPAEDLLRRFGTTPVQLELLDQIRRNTQEKFGLEAPKWSARGLSDIDLYVRLGNVWNYVLKNKRIDAGIRFGVLIPSGKKRDPKNPASIPFGGDGHTGLYFALDSEFELKEDWTIGFLLRFSERFSKTKPVRMPLAFEHPLYAAVLDDAKVNPGSTLIFSPYFRLDSIRDGLGVQMRYTLVSHTSDFTKDSKLATRMPEVRLRDVNKKSSWDAEVLSATILYDFNAVHGEYRLCPTIELTWDVPLKLLTAKGVSKTNRVSFGFCVTF